MMWVETHFQEQINDTEILVDDCDMIQAECVFRHVATGSYHKRDKHINWAKALPDGTILDGPIMEFFYKQDVILLDGTTVSAPLMDIDDNGIPKVENGRFVLLHPNTWEVLQYKTIVNPSTKQSLGFEGIQKDIDVILENAADMRSKTLEIWEKLQKFYGPEWLWVWDGKIEYGKRKRDGRMVAADVIDWDSIRLRDALLVQWSDGRLYTWNHIDKPKILEILFKKYTSILTSLFTDFQSDIAQEIFWKIDTKFISRKTPLPKNKDGSYDTSPNNIQQLLFAFGSLLREPIEPMNDYSIKRIIEAEWLDKQWYRDGESAKETLSKYERLAKITDRLIQDLGSIDDVSWVMNARAIDVLWRPD